MGRHRVWISAFILVIIGLHALPVLSYQGSRQTRWPFLTWAMYARSYPPGPIQAVTRRLVGTTAGGAEHEITPGDLGLPFPAFRNAYLMPISKHDSSAAGALTTRLNPARTDPFVAVRLEALQSTLADTGVVRDSMPVVSIRVVP